MLKGILASKCGLRMLILVARGFLEHVFHLTCSCLIFFHTRYCKELRHRAEEVVTQALELYATKGLKKAVQFLVASNFISDTPRCDRVIYSNEM